MPIDNHSDQPAGAPFQLPNSFAIDYMRTLTQESEEALRILDAFDIYDEHTKSANDIAEELATNLGGGLYNEEARRRLLICGHNELKGSDGVLWWKIMLAQVTNALTVILLVASVMSLRFSLILKFTINSCRFWLDIKRTG
jgi:magnesium-transporting ATPase (P-type)